MKVFLAVFLVATSFTALVRSQSLQLGQLPTVKIELTNDTDTPLTEGFLSNLERDAFLEVFNNLQQGITVAPEILDNLDNDQLALLAEVLADIITDADKGIGNGLADVNFESLVKGLLPESTTVDPQQAVQDFIINFGLDPLTTLQNFDPSKFPGLATRKPDPKPRSN